jgi:sugar/nucleoside kinase (ribokinase family)
MGLHGEPNPKRLLAGATKAVVVTRGAEGCAWATADGNSGETAAPPIECVDSTGAGDAFAAALLWRIIYAHEGRLTAEAMSDATRWAVAAGALACRREGAITSLPRAAELEALATAAR